TDPAVPGAFGAKPAPPAVAIMTATQSAGAQSFLVFTISIGSVHFFGWFFVGRNAEIAARPFTEVDKFTALAAERTKTVAGIFRFFFAGRTLQLILPIRSYSRLSVISTS